MLIVIIAQAWAGQSKNKATEQIDNGRDTCFGVISILLGVGEADRRKKKRSADT
jgi:hypothetical protein